MNTKISMVVGICWIFGIAGVFAQVQEQGSPEEGLSKNRQTEATKPRPQLHYFHSLTREPRPPERAPMPTSEKPHSN
jgi:hypothetical protein